MQYEVKIWGWEEKRQLEKILRNYMRWVFRLKICTPGYLITSKLNLEKLKIR